jgi:hypothetical protein
MNINVYVCVLCLRQRAYYFAKIIMYNLPNAHQLLSAELIDHILLKCEIL